MSRKRKTVDGEYSISVSSLTVDEVDSSLIPSQDGVYSLGSSTKRWILPSGTTIASPTFTNLTATGISTMDEIYNLNQVQIATGNGDIVLNPGSGIVNVNHQNIANILAMTTTSISTYVANGDLGIFSNGTGSVAVTGKVNINQSGSGATTTIGNTSNTTSIINAGLTNPTISKNGFNLALPTLSAADTIATVSQIPTQTQINSSWNYWNWGSQSTGAVPFSLTKDGRRVTLIIPGFNIGIGTATTANVVATGTPISASYRNATYSNGSGTSVTSDPLWAFFPVSIDGGNWTYGIAQLNMSTGAFQLMSNTGAAFTGSSSFTFKTIVMQWALS